MSVGVQAEPWDALARTYDARFTGPVALAEDACVRTWLRRALRQLPPDVVVYDLGCGTGHLLDLLPEVGPDRYVGLDVSPEMLRIARRDHPLYDFKEHDFRSPLPLWKPAIVVCLYGTPSYVPYPLTVFHAWAKACWPGDRLFWMFSSPHYRERKGHLVGECQLSPLPFSRVLHSLVAVEGTLLESLAWGFSPPIPLPPLRRTLHGGWLARLLEGLARLVLYGASDHAPGWEGHTYWCVDSRRLVHPDGR